MLLYIFISFILLIISIIITNHKKLNLIIFSFFGFVFFLISDIYIISDYYTGKGIDESVIYQLFYGFQGAGLISNFFTILFGFLLIISGIFFSYLIYYYFKKIKKGKNNFYKNYLSFFILFLSIAIHPICNNILKLNGYYIEDYFGKNKIENNYKHADFQNYYKIPQNQIATKNNKNLIFIYLESFENLYLDESIFPGLTKGLNKIKNESIYFNNIKQGYSSARTIAGIVGSQCGLPLVAPLGLSDSSIGDNQYLPKALCIGDFLKNAGYNLNYIGGASLDFAGKGNFLKTHGFNSIEGKEELEGQIENKNYYYDWGLYDDDVFDLAYKKYEKLSLEDEKFGLFLLSMDTHGDKGVISNKCTNLNYINQEESILNSYFCTDYLISDFINKIKNNENFKNTSIVIVSDHLAMDNNNSVEILKKKEEDRRLLFLILNSDNTEKKQINKNGSTLDIGATVLSNIGFNVEQLGLGFNLLSSSGYTLTDQNPNIIFSKWRKDYESFWDYFDNEDNN